MGLFGKKNSDVPPDVGDEGGDYVEEDNASGQEDFVDDRLQESTSSSANTPFNAQGGEGGGGGVSSEALQAVLLDMEKLKGKFDVFTNSIKGYGERLGLMSEQIGELRNMSLETEKKISSAVRDSSSAIDIVKSVEPDKLRLDYQRQDTKIQTVQERLESQKQYADSLMDEIKELRRQSQVFIGAEGLTKLNDEVKKDLIELKKLSARVQIHADKSEQMFIEFRKGTAQREKLHGSVSALEANHGELSKKVEQLKVDHTSIIRDTDFSTFKDTANKRFSNMEAAMTALHDIKQDNDEVNKMIEMTLAIAKRNKEDIVGMASRIGDDSVPEVANYENWIASLLHITDNLATQMSHIKKKLGIKIDTELKQEIKAIKQSEKELEAVEKKEGKVEEKKTTDKKEEPPLEEIPSEEKKEATSSEQPKEAAEPQLEEITEESSEEKDPSEFEEPVAGEPDAVQDAEGEGENYKEYDFEEATPPDNPVEQLAEETQQNADLQDEYQPQSQILRGAAVSAVVEAAGEANEEAKETKKNEIREEAKQALAQQAQEMAEHPIEKIEQEVEDEVDPFAEDELHAMEEIDEDSIKQIVKEEVLNQAKAAAHTVHKTKKAQQQKKVALEMTEAPPAAPKRSIETMTRNAEHALFKNVHPDNAFMTHDGKKISNVYDLLSYVVVLEDTVFGNFVNSEKNDFSEWVRNSVGDHALADRLKPLQTREEISKELMNRIDEAQQEQMGGTQ